MKLTPEMIDAALIQLRMIFENDAVEDLPEDVKETSKPFFDSLDRWSDRMKAGATK